VDFVPGPLYLGLFAYILFGFGASALELRRKRRLATAVEQKAQLKFIALALGLTIAFGTLANLVLPLLGYTRAAVFGPASTLCFVLFTAYAMIKHHLLDVKVIAAELFGVLLSFVTFFQIFSADSVADYALRVFIFAATAVVAVLLIKSVIKEVEGRQQIEKQAVELEVRNKRLRKLDELKSTMVSIASHQLRGPLGGMRGYMTMFRDGDLGPLSDRQKEIVGMNLNVLSRLLNAVENFLDITKLESGKMNLKPEVLPFDDAVEDVWKEFRILFEKKPLAFELKIEAPRPVWVRFDPEKIKHVVFNIIDNALKYTEKGGVTVRLRADGKDALLEISDTGMGVPPEDVHRLFGKFERGELVVDRGGSGLGLYVVKMLTEHEEHRGKVWVSSPGVGKGATFHVSLPLAPHFDPPQSA
jgi:signal transduction histidine kinase